MNKTVLRFLSELEEAVNFCHFKSNNNLSEALDCIGDLDLLIDQNDFNAFFIVASKWNFRVAKDKYFFTTPNVFHLYGLDPETCKMIHLHVYFKFVTGGSLFKNYHIPLEDAFLQNTEKLLGVPVPKKEYDLLLFVIRKYIEQPSLLEHYLFFRDKKNIRAELSWLMEDLNKETLDGAVKDYLPFFPVALFQDCLAALKDNKGFLRRIALGIKVRKYFPEKVMPEWRASIERTRIYSRAFWKARLRSDRSDRYIFPSGRIIAFVGSEASGKSTLSRNVARWYGQAFDTKHIHLGKPRKSLVTRPFRAAIFVYSKTKSLFRRPQPAAKTNMVPVGDINMPHPIMLVLDAIDRYKATKQCAIDALNGWTIVTDRYPSITAGVDGPRLMPKGWFTNILARIEQHYYARISLPDIVFKAEAPLDTTLKRNAERNSPEPEDFVRQRFEAAKNIQILDKNQYLVDTTQSEDSCIRLIMQKLWVGNRV